MAEMLLFAFGANFSGSMMYKVWSQELVPTLLRSTGQGLTIAFARLLAALFAFVTPALLTTNNSLSFGLFWVPWLPQATELEPVDVVFPEVSSLPTA